MAYKFQLGAASLAGTTTFKDGLSANDQNITNVGDIDVDSISPDGTELTMILTHDQSSALEILNGTNGTSYMKFDTSNGADLVSMEVPLQIDDDKKLFFRDSAVHISSDADGHLQARADNTINLNINGTDRATVTSAGLDVVGALSCDTSLTIDTTAISAAEIGVLDSVTAGTAAASKAVVLDASKNITGINNLTVEGNLTVQGTTTQVDTTNLQVKDKNILINDGGAAASGDGAGIDIEEDGSVAGFIKVSGSRGEWHLKAPNSSTLTIDMDANGEIQFDAAKKITVAGDLTVNADTTISTFGASLVDDANAAAARTTLGLGNMAEQANGSVNIDGGDIASAVVINKSPVITLGGDLTGNATLTNLGNATLTATIAGGAVEATMLNTNVISGQGNFTGASTDIENSDEILFSDGGVLKRLSMETAQSFFQTGVTADSAGGFAYNAYSINTATATNANGNTGFYAPSGSNAANPISASHAANIHLSGSWENGMTLFIKAPSNASSFNLTVHASGSDKIDGSSTLTLESDNAAVTLLRCHSNRWSIV